ncbi:hypothetical protein [Parafilimonas terrae]|uniref:Helix-turn-helix domain-containing protein n=1 Tax=Parafilimonas terrae TaxID=1465490 RepID=A0A1I5WEQ0_9BACT|nr:hypothetical protein [Parafilimonas terrae]SFQ18141.1 hypothetical protein SAMN05444277_106134 [Parafilimonas terrae]
MKPAITKTRKPYYNKRIKPGVKPIPVTNTTINDWVDKQVILETFKLSERTLQNYRSKRIIPSSNIGGKIFYCLHGILRVLEHNMG